MSEVFEHRIYNAKGVLVKEWHEIFNAEGLSTLLGVWREWTPLGTLILEVNYTDDQLDGRERRWHSNGGLASIGLFRLGKRHGPLLSFDQSGAWVEATPFDGGKRRGIGFRRVSDRSAEVLRFDLDGATASLGEMDLSTACRLFVDSAVWPPEYECVRSSVTVENCETRFR